MVLCVQGVVRPLFNGWGGVVTAGLGVGGGPALSALTQLQFTSTSSILLEQNQPLLSLVREE